MYWRLFHFVILSLLLMRVATSESIPGNADKPSTNGEGVASLSGARSPEDLAARIGKLLVTSTRSDLDRLVTVSDCTLSLAAGWERVRRTMPEAERGDVVVPDSPAVSRFLGLVEGRLRVPIPKTWAETLQSSAGHGQKSTSFEVFDRKTGENRCRFSTAYAHEVQTRGIGRAAKRKAS
jgi:hypothetical protein